MRPAFSALWNLDLAFADIVSTSSDPRLGAIRIAWWRERLDELGASELAPAPEPRLEAVTRELLPRKIEGRLLSRLEDGWLPLLEPFPWGERQVEGLKLRGKLLFEIGALLLGSNDVMTSVGALWSLVDAAHHCSDATSRRLLLEEARSLSKSLPSKMSRNVRPLTVLGALAVADACREGERRRRLSAALRHRLTGTFPRA